MLLHLHLLWHKVPVYTLMFLGATALLCFLSLCQKIYSISHFSDKYFHALYAIIHEDQEALI